MHWLLSAGRGSAGGCSKHEGEQEGSAKSKAERPRLFDTQHSTMLNCGSETFEQHTVAEGVSVFRFHSGFHSKALQRERTVPSGGQPGRCARHGRGAAAAGDCGTGMEAAARWRLGASQAQAQRGACRSPEADIAARHLDCEALGFSTLPRTISSASRLTRLMLLEQRGFYECSGLDGVDSCKVVMDWARG